MTHWTIQEARDRYNILPWGGGYFDINSQGHLAVQLQNQYGIQSVDLYELIEKLKSQGLTPPILVRFPDILHHRISSLNKAFTDAISTYGFSGRYSAVYPIKVNQQYSVVNEISQHSNPAIGLEAGSKTELLAVLALSNTQSRLIVCNGYKDREYIRIALIGQQLGHDIFIVIEKLSELDIIINEARDLGVTPLLGIRVRLSSVGSGKWQNSGGEKSKFGVSSLQLIELLAKLKDAQLTESLKLLHFHLGSQITDIHDIQQSMTECARYFAELHRLKFTIDYVDIGGGLSIDYEGTASRNYFSMNYSIDEYAHSIVDALHKICEQNAIKHPNIISESGRAITAHHAVLITNVIDVDKPPTPNIPKWEPGTNIGEIELLAQYLQDLYQNVGNPVETLHKTVKVTTDINHLFATGAVSLQQKSLAEQLYYKISQLVQSRLHIANRDHRAVLDSLNEKLATKYFCNFSLFQSLPDVWAIDQIFPVAPLHRLDENPTQRGVLQDITCDSDGRIDSYVDGLGIQTSMALHEFKHGEPYFLGVFLVGAYQEILGDMHNLFGDTNSVNIKATATGYDLSNIQRGDSADYVLRHIHFDTEHFKQTYKTQLAATTLPQNIQDSFMEELAAGLTGYTYLED